MTTVASVAQGRQRFVFFYNRWRRGRIVPSRRSVDYMCGRYFRRSDKQRIAEHFRVHGPSVPDFGESFKIQLAASFESFFGCAAEAAQVSGRLSARL